MKKYGTVYKRARSVNLVDGWLERYNEFKEFEPRTIDVLGIENERLIMPNIGTDGEDYLPLAKCVFNSSKIDNGIEFTHNAVAQYFSILSSIFDFQKRLPDDELFLHDDLHANNFVVFTNGKVILIDPDSFTTIKVPNKKYKYSHLHQMTHGFMTIMMGLQRTYDSIGEK